MPRPDSVERWAERAEFDQPLRWGQVERRLMSRRVPLVEGDSRAAESIFAVAQIGFVLIVAVLLGSPVVGLGAALAARAATGSTAQTWVDVAMGGLLIAAATGVAAVVKFAQDRTGTLAELLGAGLHAGCSAAALVSLRGTSDVEGSEAAALYALVATVLGGISFLLFALSRPALESPWRRRERNLPKNKYMYPRYEQARATVLSVVERRGLVHLDPARRAELARAPLGTWHTFDRDGSTGTSG